MTVKEDVRLMLEAIRKERESFKNSPEKARKYLIRVGILDKTGKRLAKRYR